MIEQAVGVLTRGHALFAGTPGAVGDGSGELNSRADRITQQTSGGGLPARAVVHSDAGVAGLRRVANTDGGLTRIVSAARDNHAQTANATRVILDAAQADRIPAGDTPMGQREAALRMIARLRAQHGHIVRSRSQAVRLAARLRRLLYARQRARSAALDAGPSVGGGNGRAAIRAAMNRALDIKGIHDPVARARWLRGADVLTGRESSHDNTRVNNWDSNAAKGTPSKYAFQFIEPTFRSYHEPGTSPNQSNLVSQSAAWINYAMGRYGVHADASNLAARIQQADPTRGPKGY